MKHFVGCVTISHNNRFNFKHVSRYFFSYCRVNPYFPEKLNDVATIRSFVQIFYFSINSTKSVLIDKMEVLFQNPLYCFSSANPGGVCVPVPTGFVRTRGRVTNFHAFLFSLQEIHTRRPAQ